MCRRMNTSLVNFVKAVEFVLRKQRETRRQREGFYEPIRRAQKQDPIYLV
jgi:hypothetical protein